MKRLHKVLVSALAILISAALIYGNLAFYSDYSSKMDSAIANVRAAQKNLITLKTAAFKEITILNEMKRQNYDAWGSEGLEDFNTMENLLVFLAQDKTDELEWREYEFMCGDFSLVLMKSAAEKGYRLYAMSIFSMFGGHMMNFAIIEKEWEGEPHKLVVAVEPQTDELVILGRLSDAELWNDSSKWQDIFDFGTD